MEKTMKRKVNIWLIGYTDEDGCILRKMQNIVCKECGFVLVEPKEGWEETVWGLLNWGCWGCEAVKPAEVHSPLDHCNADIILKMEGDSVYKGALDFGFKDFASLEEAVKHLSKNSRLWPLNEYGV